MPVVDTPARSRDLSRLLMNPAVSRLFTAEVDGEKHIVIVDIEDSLGFLFDQVEQLQTANVAVFDGEEFVGVMVTKKAPDEGPMDHAHPDGKVGMLWDVVKALGGITLTQHVPSLELAGSTY